MSYCLNPDCQKPHNPADAKFCIRCGTKLLLGDRYRSLKLISKGKLNRTFLGVDECKPSKPQCIIKQFFTQAQGTDNAKEAEELFQQKAIRLEELGNHPQIPDLLAHFTQNQQQYLVQELIDGQSLAEELETNGPFNENQIRQLLNELLPILQFIHDRNTIHRDIRPKNIIRRAISTLSPVAEGTSSTSGEEATATHLVLVDFGAAKFASSSGLPSTATIIGTAGYVAPEQAMGRGTYASDLYSLGVTCIHLLTKTDPIELYSIGDATWAWRERLSSPVSEELGLVLDKMLEHATRRRYQSAVDVLNDLNLLEKASQPATIPTPSVVPSSQPLSQVPTLVEETPTPPTPLVEKAPTPQAPLVEEVLTPQTQSHNWTCIQTLGEQSDKRADWYSGITCVAFSPDGQLVVGGSEDYTIKIWEASTGSEIHKITAHSNFVNSIAISPDGKLLASVGGDIIKLWDLNTGQEVHTWTGHSQLIRSVAFSPDGQMLATGANDKIVKLWNRNTGEEIRSMSATNLIEIVSFSRDGQIVATGDWDNRVMLWNVNTGEEIRTLSGHSRKVRAISFSPDGQTLVTGSSDKTIKIWQVETGELVRTLTGHSGWFAGVNSVIFSPDGQMLASGSDDKTIKLWDAKTGQEITTLSQHSKGVTSVTFSPDGHSLASGSGDRTVKIWKCG
ncbi:MAG TPA: WD40 repeat domain-containing serine/threonine-protein kinase [Allocoleopsis sp.]